MTTEDTHEIKPLTWTPGMPDEFHVAYSGELEGGQLCRIEIPLPEGRHKVVVTVDKVALWPTRT